MTGCEPLSGDCDAGEKCAVATNTQGETFGYCEFDGPGAQGDDCTESRDCGVNLACIAPLSGGVACEALCRTGVDGDCEDGVLCLPLLGTPGYGFCNPG